MLKILHLWALGIAFGGGFARLVLGYYMARFPETAAALAAPQKSLAQANYLAILALWLTGVPLWITAYDGRMDLGGAFHLKLTLAALFSGLAFYVWNRTRQGNPPNPKMGRKTGITTLSLAALTIAAAV
ncbi:MAG: hypothetical protein ACPGVJ_09930, partial [Mangrovicoccus sp.]